MMMQKDGLMVLGVHSDNHVKIYDLHTSNVVDGWSNADQAVGISYVNSPVFASAFYMLTGFILWRGEIDPTNTLLTSASFIHSDNSPTALLMVTDVTFAIASDNGGTYVVKLRNIDNWVMRNVLTTQTISPTGTTPHLKLGSGIILIAGSYPEILWTDTGFGSTSQINACVGSKTTTLGLTIDTTNNYAYELAAWASGSQIASHELVVGSGYFIRISITGPITSNSVPCAGMQKFPTTDYIFLAVDSSILIYQASTLAPVTFQTSPPVTSQFKSNSLTARGHIDITTPNLVDFSLIESSTGNVFLIKAQVFGCPVGLTMVNGVCTALPSPSTSSPSMPKLQIASFVKEERAALLLFTESITLSSMTPLASAFSIDVFDLVDSRSYPCPIPSACSFTLHDSGITITLFFPGANIIRGRLTIGLAPGIVSSPITSADGLRPFTDYPIVVEDIVLADTSTGTAKTLSSFSETSSNIVEVGRSATQLVNTFSKPGAAVGLDRMVSELLYLRVVDGPNLFYPDLVLNSLAGSNILPFSIGNPLVDEGSPIRITSMKLPELNIDDAESCTLSKYFSANSVKCNIFLNFGEDLVTTAGILILNLLVSLTFLLAWLKKPSDYKPTSLCGRLFAIVGRSYGVKYFFTKIDGMSLEIMIYLVINGLNPDKSEAVLFAGFFVSWIVFAIYIGYAVLLVLFIEKVRKELRVSKASDKEEASNPQKSPEPEKSEQTSKANLAMLGTAGNSPISRPKSRNALESPKADDDSSKVALSPEEKLNLKQLHEENYQKVAQEQSPTIVENKQVTKEEKKEVSPNNEKKEKREELSEAVNFYSLRYWVAGGAVEELKVPKRQLVLYTPLVNLSRNCLLSLVLYTCSNKGFLQVILLLIIQTAGLSWTLIFMPKFSRLDNIKESAEQILSWIYLFLKLICLFNIRENTRQITVGGIMSFILVLMILMNLVYSFYMTVMLVWEIIVGVITFCNSKPEKGEDSSIKTSPLISKNSLKEKSLSKNIVLHKPGGASAAAKQSFQSPGAPTQNIELSQPIEWPDNPNEKYPKAYDL